MERQQRKEDTTLVPRYVTIIIITIIISIAIFDVVTIDASQGLKQRTQAGSVADKI